MPGDLPDIEQQFVADVSRWLAGIEAMIQAGREFIQENEESLVSVEELQVGIDHLDGKDVTIGVLGVDEDITLVQALKAEIDSVESKVVEVRAIVTGDDFASDPAAIREMSAAFQDLQGSADDLTANLDDVQRAWMEARDAGEEFMPTAEAVDSAMQDVGDSVRDASTGMGQAITDADRLKQGFSVLGDSALSDAEKVKSLESILADMVKHSAEYNTLVPEYLRLTLPSTMGGAFTGPPGSLFNPNGAYAYSGNDPAAAAASAAANDKLADSIAAVTAADAAGAAMAGNKTGKISALQQAIDMIGLSESDVALLSERSGNAIFNQGNAAVDKRDKILALMDSVDMLSDDETRNIWVIEDANKAMDDAASSTAKAGNAAGQADRQFRVLGTGFRVSGYGLHWLIAGTSEFLAVFVPAMIAAGAAAGAMMEGVGWIGDRLQATFYSTEATAATLGKTTGNLYGLKDSLQQAQTEADPHIWELLGAGVNAAKESFGNFWSQGDLVVDMLDRFAAHVDLALGSTLGGQAQGAIKDMVSDLQGLGQVLGNVGHIILSWATDMPGVAEVVLHVFSVITGVLNTFFQNKLVGYGVTLFMFIEELSRWSGLLLNMLAPMVTAIGGVIGKLGVQLLDLNTGLEETDALAFATGDAMLTAGADAEIMGGEMATAGEMTKTFAGAMKMLFVTPVGWFILAAAGIVALTYELDHMQNAWESAFSKMDSTMSSAGPIQGLTDVINMVTTLQNKMNSGTLSGWDATIAPVQMDVLINTEASLLGMNTKINGSYYSLATSFALAQAAGVQMNDMFQQNGQLTATATQMVKNLIAGYQQMGQTGSMLAQDINAIDVQTLAQQTDVSKLNQAWDNFLSTVTGGTGALAGLNSDLLTIGNVTSDATSKITAFGQQSDGTNLSVKQIAKSLESFSGTSAQVWTNYNSALTQAGSVTDWLRTAISEGAITQGEYTDSIKGVVSELLPYASHSKTAVAELDAIAEQTGEVTTNYQSLAQWTGNAKDDQKELNNTVNQGTQAMSNLGDIAAELSDTLDSEITSALAEGSANFKGITSAAQNFTSQLHNGVIATTSFDGAQDALVKQLLAAGEPLNDVTGVIDTMAKRAGYSGGEISYMNDQIKNLVSSMSKIHNVNATVSVQEVYTTSGNNSAGVGHIVGSTAGMASGGRIPGYGGGDRIPIMAEAGEAIVPKHLVAGVAPYLGAHGVPGFAKGGVVESPMEKVISEWAGHIWHDYMRQFGRKGPMALSKIKDIWGPGKFPDTGIWSNPQYRDLRSDERKDMDPYYLKDLMYGKVLDDISSLKKGEASQIANWKYDEKHYGNPNDSAYWSKVYRDDISYAQGKISEYDAKLAGTTDKKLRADYTRDIAKYTADLARYRKDLTDDNSYNTYAGDISKLEKTDATKLRDFQAELSSIFRSMGYAQGGLIPFGHYDSGGYLPLGLSMALNTTGRPEPVGGAGDSAGGGPIHVHMHVGGREIAEAVLPDMISATARYGIRNSGKVTGLMRPS